MADGIESGQNYIISADHVVLAGTTQTFTFNLTGVAGRVRLTQIVALDNRRPSPNSSFGVASPFDLLVARIMVERFETTRAQDILIDGEPPIDAIAGADAGLPGILSAIEMLQARSRVLIDIRNTTAQAIRLAIILVGHSLYEDDEYFARYRGGGFAVTERGRLPRETT